MPKPENPGKSGLHGPGRDIDKWLPPRRPWIAVSVLDALSVSEEVLFDPATQTIELLGHQFDADGDQVPQVDVTVQQSETGATLVVIYPLRQLLYKVVDKADVA